MNEIDRGNLDLRIKQLSSSVAFIKIGAKTEAEFSEKKDRYDDALKACRAALSEGIVPGGGYSYISFLQSEAFEDISKRVGKEISAIMRKALLSPLRTLLDNAFLSDKFSAILTEMSECTETNHGYNIKTNKFENLLEAGVVDPFKVTRAALENAASIATLMMTCSGVITDFETGPQKVIDVSKNIPSLY